MFRQPHENFVERQGAEPYSGVPMPSTPPTTHGCDGVRHSVGGENIITRADERPEVGERSNGGCGDRRKCCPACGADGLGLGLGLGLCARRGLWALLRGFGLGFTAKGAAAALFQGLRKRSVVSALRSVVQKDTLRFGAFVGGLTGFVSAVSCALANARGKHDWKNRAVAGTYQAPRPVGRPPSSPTVDVFTL